MAGRKNPDSIRRNRDLKYVEEIMIGQTENHLAALHRAIQRRDQAAYRRAMSAMRHHLESIDDLVEGRRSYH